MANRRSKIENPKSPGFPNAQRVFNYACDVLAGNIVAGRYVIAACNRHLEDLKEGPLRGLVWRPEKAEAAQDFFETTLFLEPGKPFHLQDFQSFIIGSVFGWYRKDADTGELRRRFRTLYAEMGKGNGKTPLMAGIGLYGLTLDREEAAEIYAAAVAKDQAKICFNDAKRMVRASPELLSRVTVLTGNLSAPARSARFTVLSSEDKVHHGLRVHMGLLDEIHAHASAAVVDTIEAGTKNCRNSLIVLITNSGASRMGPCWAYRSRAEDMLQGKPDDSLFAYVCTLDPCQACASKGKNQVDLKCRKCDDWRDLDLLAKANPGLGTILDRDYVRARIALAQRMPSKLNNVLQLNCCIWTESNNGWLDMYAWRNKCHNPKLRLEQFKGKPCWIGMDAANRVDATVKVRLFESQPGSGALDPKALNAAAQEAIKEARAGDAGSAVEKLAAAGYAIFLTCYVPEDMVANSSQANHEAYTTWKQQGHLVVTPGAVTDFARIEDDLRQDAQDFQVRRLQADPRELGYLLQRVQGWAGFEVVQVSQGAVMISAPMKMFEGLVAAALIQHDGNPILDWMLGNIELKVTRTGGPVKYYYPTRPSESKKIDAGPAAFMALDGCLRGGDDGPSIYETRGIRSA